MTKCQNCKTTQGPFVREVVKVPPMSFVLIGCKDSTGCSKRRNELDARRYGPQAPR